MSGAGRGTPRVSPVSVRPTPGGATAGSVFDVPTAGFIYRADFTVQDFPLSPFSAYAGTVEPPLGSTRAGIRIHHSKADPAAVLVLRVSWQDPNGMDPALLSLPSSESAGIVTMAGKEQRFTAATPEFFSFVIPPIYRLGQSALTLPISFYVAETNAAVPGQVTLSEFFADNVSPLPYEPNFTV